MKLNKNPFTRNVKVAQEVYFYYSFTRKQEIPTVADKDLLIEFPGGTTVP